jgi:hypothetical protein
MSQVGEVVVTLQKKTACYGVLYSAGLPYYFTAACLLSQSAHCFFLFIDFDLGRACCVARALTPYFRLLISTYVIWLRFRTNTASFTGPFLTVEVTWVTQVSQVIVSFTP